MDIRSLKVKLSGDVLKYIKLLTEPIFTLKSTPLKIFIDNAAKLQYNKEKIKYTSLLPYNFKGIFNF